MVGEEKQETKPKKKHIERKESKLERSEIEQNVMKTNQYEGDAEFSESLDINVSINEDVKNISSITEPETILATDDKSYHCVFCGKDFTTNARFKVHTLVHTKEKPFNCTQCDKTFNQSSNMYSHMKRHHAI